MFEFAFIVSFLASFLMQSSIASPSEVPAGWCANHQAATVEQDCYQDIVPCNYLPPDGIDMIDFDARSKQDWTEYISAKDHATGKYMVFRANSGIGASHWEVLANVKADSIAVASTDYTNYKAPVYFWAIVDNEIRLYGTPETTNPGVGEYKVIEPASDDHVWTSVNWDQTAYLFDHSYLYAVDSKNNQVYQWDPITDGVESSQKKLVAGNTDGVAADDETHLNHPQDVQSANGTLYISQGTGENNQYRVVSWHPSSTKRDFVFDFTITGRFGYVVVPDIYISEIGDVTIYYRYGDDSVYQQCVTIPDGEAMLQSGGCGAGHAKNQIVNAGDGCLSFNPIIGMEVWDYNANPNRFVMWFPQDVSCKPTTTTTSTTQVVTTTSVVPSTTTQSSPATTTSCSDKDCSIGDNQCSSYIPGSYCKYWEVPRVCSGSDKPCSCDETVTTTTSTGGEPVTTSAPTTPFNCHNGDAFCCSQYSGSYCKYWANPSVCSGTNIPCSCDIQA